MKAPNLTLPEKYILTEDEIVTPSDGIHPESIIIPKGSEFVHCPDFGKYYYHCKEHGAYFPISRLNQLHLDGKATVSP